MARWFIVIAGIIAEFGVNLALQQGYCDAWPSWIVKSALIVPVLVVAFAAATSKIARNFVANRKMLSLLIYISGSVVVGLVLWVIVFKTGPRQENSATITPYVFAKLSIDSFGAYPSFDSKMAKVRFTLKNGGIRVDNIRATYRSKCIYYTELLSISGTLAPNEEVETISIYIPIGENQDDLVILTVYCDATIDLAVGHFVSEHTFPLTTDTIRDGNVVKSVSNKYREGVPPTYAEVFKSSWNQLDKEEGIIQFTPPEGTPENPNTIIIKRSSKAFIFDPKKRQVGFSMLTKNGRSINLGLPLEKPGPYHNILIGWRPIGGRLQVDGKTVQDYDK